MSSDPWRVMVVQPYIASYREKFWGRVTALTPQHGLEVTLAAGSPTGEQALRHDSSDLDAVIPLPTRSLNLAGKTLRWQSSWRLKGQFDGAVLEASAGFLDTTRFLADRNFPTAIWGHIGSYVGPGGGIESAIERWQLRRARHVFSYTENGGRVASELGVPPEVVTVLNNSIDVEELAHLRRALSVTEAAAILGIDERQRCLAFVGGLDSSKRVQFLLDGWKLVQARLPAYSLLLAGEGVLADYVDARIESGDVLNVKRLGYAGAREKAAIGVVSDAILMPGRVGLVAVESRAMGLPIITTDWPYHAPEFEYLEPGVDSLVAPDRVDSYADTIVAAVDADAHGWLRAAKNRCLELAGQPSVDRMAESFVDGLLKLREGGSR